MARVKFNVTPHADLKTAWGYVVEVTADGVFGEVSDSLLDSEVAAGRVQAPAVQEPVAKVDGRKKDAKLV